ncbi:MAG: zinc ribbon domain-containing protein [Lachnospiraceae bacterium]|nr:zinc ribbon domain-containing protein [Lachnospiraceae bacterium]
MFCWKCGTKLDDDAQICTCCGEIFSEELEQKAQRVKRIKRIILAVLAVFLTAALLCAVSAVGRLYARQMLVGIWRCTSDWPDVYRLGVDGEETLQIPDNTYPTHQFWEFGDDGLAAYYTIAADEAVWKEKIAAYNAAALHAEELSEDELKAELKALGCSSMEELNEQVYEKYRRNWAIFSYTFDGRTIHIGSADEGYETNMRVTVQKNQLTVLDDDHPEEWTDGLPEVYERYIWPEESVSPLQRYEQFLQELNAIFSEESE